MKQIRFLFMGVCLALTTANAQQAFRYDTIRTGSPTNSGYGTAPFRYDTIRSTKSSGSSGRQTAGTTRTAGYGTTQRSSSPEQTKSSFDKRNLFFGGSLGLQFGDYTLVDISPQVGYAFNQYCAAGVGISYTYQSADFYEYKYTRSYAGFNIFGRFYPIRNIVLSVQPEADYLWGKDKYYSGYEVSADKFVPVLLLGAGIRIPAGNAGGVMMMIQYDVVQNDYSPYGNNIFYTVGYTFGF
ncbi:MAG: hypothetical protein FWF54_02125 [Candidatus Azobacteroides sp.]|jgi:hypothetical protein|nr:hypothetical protein [Candidatus Azobacteroides sp.]